MISTSSQTAKEISSNTPRKLKQKKLIKVQKQKINRLKAVLGKAPKGKVARQEKALEEALEKLPTNLANFVRMQIKLHGKKKHGRRYSPELKSLAISIFHASGKAYCLLSKLFILPSKSSLNRYISRMPDKTGISQGSLKIIEKKVMQMNLQDRECTLCMDEISLKTNLFYSVPSDKIIGLEDFGSYRTNEVATSAFVLLIRSISGNWKQPLGYYLVNGGCPSDIMEDIVKEAIDKLECIGLNIVVVMSDQGSNFYSLATRLEVTPEKPWFVHNGRKIFLMFDPPHLIKSVRNNLIKYSFRFGEHVASWEDIEAVYSRDSALPIRSVPKLTEKHIRPNNFNKMKVKLATQVLSHTVAATICTYVSVGALPSSAMGTAEFIEKFDSTFDCVNSSSLQSTKVLKCALSDQTKHQDFMKEAIGFIKGLKVVNGNEEVTGRIKCLKGWVMTLNAILLIWEHLKKTRDFKFLLTRRLNTDPIENFFGTIRQQGGNSDNPTPSQFTSAFRKLFFSSFLTSSEGNCAADFDKLLANFEKKPKAKPLVTKPNMPQTLQIGPTDYRDECNVNSDIVKDNATAYVAGYLIHKSQKIHSCPTCRNAIQCDDLDDNRKRFCFFKAFDQAETTFGGLHAPTNDFLDYIMKLEDVFFENFSIYTKSLTVGKDILMLLNKIPLPFKCCDEFPLEFIRKLFLRLRIYYSLKFANRELSSTKKKNRKYLKVAHL